MYRPIWITKQDRLYQAILWRESPIQPLKTYLLKTVTYGTSSAPFQATRCLNYLADRNMNKFPTGARVIKSEFYMDDMISGANTREELMKIKTDVESILAQGNFELKKWFSNDKIFRESIGEAEKETPLRINDVDIIKTLGIIWDPFEDKFCFRWSLKEISSAITKRKVLSDLASLFDPLGLLNPIIVLGKIFLQELWTMKMSWDEQLPSNMAEQWIRFCHQLKAVDTIRIPRYIFTTTTLQSRELHGFADASTRAYGCSIYICCKNLSGKRITNLVAAKSKVAPLKSLSLPRLELCAALLLTRLYNSIRSLLNPLDKVYFWTDSEIVLHWLHGHPSTWSTFFSHRVAEIQETTGNHVRWRHVPSRSNPADIISRGACVNDLINSMWFTGPQFLQNPPESWPPEKIIDSERANIPEKRKTKTVLVIDDKGLDLIESHKYVNNFPKLRRIFAYVIRFYKIVSLKRQKIAHKYPEELTPQELEETLLRMVFAVQRKSFAQELKSLQKNGRISPKSCIQNLSPFLDGHSPNLLRVGGRLQNADIPYCTKHPILLHNQIMGQLPALRLESVRAFLHSGVDFCGPFWITERLRGRVRQKAYVAVFVCFASKAIHLEIVSDLTSNAFIATLSRFIGRRGICATMSCDNATNFVGAKTKLAEFRQQFYSQQNHKEISKYCLEAGINFRFIPPRTPHFGGLWEAAVKSAKYHLVRTVGEQALTFEELRTVAVKVEAILNSRPISAMSSNPSDDTALTPGNFLVNGPLNALLEPDYTDRKLSSLDRWQRLTFIQQHFWRRWSNEYVLQFQQKYKCSGYSPDVKENMLVLVADDLLPPQHWLLGYWV